MPDTVDDLIRTALMARVREVARELNVPPAAVVRWAIQRYLDEHEAAATRQRRAAGLAHLVNLARCGCAMRHSY